ncbi:MAG: LTA synthase family protein [Clostridia bacterium]|nr:LTA synthase family protein [Clostridia bacterium]
MKDKIYNFIDAVDRNSYTRDIISMLYLPISLVYMEMLAKQKIFGNVFDEKFKYLILLTLGMGMLLSVGGMLLPGRIRRRVYKVLLCVLAVWFSFHTIYHHNFHTFFSWQTLGQAADVTQFWKEAIVATVGVWYMILAYFIPFALMCFTGRYIIDDDAERNLPYAGIAFAAFAMCYFPALIKINQSKSNSGEYTPYYYYTFLQSDLDTSFQYYGIFNTTRLDIKQLLFGSPVEEMNLDDPVEDDPLLPEEEQQVEYGWNVMDIDFDKAAKSTKNSQLKSMDKYFKSVQPTRQNEYTGMFKGKNLIFITLEGFSDKVIDRDFTPTLYKMSTEGFVFSNFYNSVWGGSTASGEYSNMTGNFYTTANCLKASGSKYQPLALGNQFKKLGYKTFAYHNNSYTYYGRNKSHPNFGYKWKAIGNGLKLKSNCWPRSDEEMAEATLKEYIGLDVPFHAYYMSVSGHANYSFSGNMMSARHRKDLPESLRTASEGVQAFNACQYEVELMLKEMVDELEAAGELDDTVFAMAADHYPYALSDSELAEMYGLPKSDIRNNFDLYRNCFILWCSSMEEPVVVDKPCSTIDILPTLSNLFGLEYDSRLLMGSDIMAEGDHFALLKVNGWSWISTQGEYNSAAKRFTPSDDCVLSESEQSDYIKRMNTIVKGKTTYSKQILDKDYYKHIYSFITKKNSDSQDSASSTEQDSAEQTDGSQTANN